MTRPKGIPGYSRLLLDFGLCKENEVVEGKHKHVALLAALVLPLRVVGTADERDLARVVERTVRLDKWDGLHTQTN